MDSTPTALDVWLRDYGGLAHKLPDIAGTYRGKHLVIVGDAKGVWDDLEAFNCRCDLRRGSVHRDGWDFMTVNKIVELFPGDIEHAYSNEPKVLNAFIAARRNEYTREFNGPKHTHSFSDGTEYRWPWGGWGTSALGATFVGIMLGYDPPIVLAGAPLDNGPHNGEPDWRRCQFTREAADSVDLGMNKHWQRLLKAMPGYVRSMSGRTKLWLGAPDEQWLT